ncbi:MAG: hypothetical protein GVY29_11750 [Spirochaetes bacterium]|nr:hypothetical protein [Spirochaetota bacterium]
MHGARLTNFYPLYDGANDQVDRVLPVRRAIFQRILPRYELSTSETRDEGVGPNFIETADWEPPGAPSPGAARGSVAAPSGVAAPEEQAPTVAPTAALLETPVMRPRAPLPAGQGLRVDILV